MAKNMGENETLYVGRAIGQWRMIANALRVAANHEDFGFVKKTYERMASDIEVSLPPKPQSGRSE